MIKKIIFHFCFLIKTILFLKQIKPKQKRNMKTHTNVAISLLFMLNLPACFPQYPPINCKDALLTANCQCMCIVESNMSILMCNRGYVNKIPDINGFTKFVAVNAFDKWPVVPESGRTLNFLFLDMNQIDSLGDVSNLVNLVFLNLSHNRIVKFDSSLASLKYLGELDLSYNLIEEVNMGDLVFDPRRDRDFYGSDTYILGDRLFSELRAIFLTGNRIKAIQSLDLLFIGMPMLEWAFFQQNKLTSLEIPALSPQSEQIIQKMSSGDARMPNLTAKEFNLYFTLNSIEYVHFNFAVVLKDVFKPYEKYFLTKFMSLRVLNQKTKINCDCELYADMKFLHERLVKRGDITIPESIILITNLKCTKEKTEYVLFDAIRANKVHESDFCTINSSITLDAAFSMTTNEVTLYMDELNSGGSTRFCYFNVIKWVYVSWR